MKYKFKKGDRIIITKDLFVDYYGKGAIGTVMEDNCDIPFVQFDESKLVKKDSSGTDFGDLYPTYTWSICQSEAELYKECV